MESNRKEALRFKRQVKAIDAQLNVNKRQVEGIFKMRRRSDSPVSVRKHINDYHRTKILRLRNDLTALKQRSRAIIKMKLSNSPEQPRKPLTQLLKKVP